jgi:hemerythrin-like domain-containing protein
MLPIDALMQEHRLIERMISQMRKERLEMQKANDVNSTFIDVAVDFIKVYADRCHHGKEEGVLFRKLSGIQLSSEHAGMMRELIDEHVYARRTTGNLVKAKDRYGKGEDEARNDVWKLLNDLVEFYPKHIEKEDKKFFYPSMNYFAGQEQEAMLNEFWDFDRKIVHEHYAKLLDEMEETTQAKSDA